MRHSQEIGFPMAFYRRNLPHCQLEDSRIFITWRLNGALPRGTVTLGCVAWQHELAGRRFVQADQLLNKAQTGPRWLGEPTVASCVENILIRGWKTLEQYELHAYVIMPNHVHLLIHPRLPIAKIMRGMKGVSSRDANRILGREGRTFWQDEYEFGKYGLTLG